MSVYYVTIISCIACGLIASKVEGNTESFFLGVITGLLVGIFVILLSIHKRLAGQPKP